MLFDRGEAPSLEKARGALIMARAVKINDAYIDKAGCLGAVDAGNLYQG
jgi:hypothetical protein